MNKAMTLLLRPTVRRSLSVLILVGIDALALFSGLALVSYVVGDGSRPGRSSFFVLAFLVVWFAIFAAQGLYGRGPKRRNPGTLVRALLLGGGLLVIGSITSYPRSGFSVKEIVLAVFFAILLDIGLRLLYEQGIELVLAGGLDRIPTLIIGEDAERARIKQAMESKGGPWSCAGELRTNGGGVDLPALRLLLNRTEAQNVVLSGVEQLSDKQFLDLLRSMWLRRVGVKVVPDAATLISGKPAISHDIGIPLLEVAYPQLDKRQWALKRMLDVAGSLAGLVLLSPILLGIAVAIKLTSSGPVLYKQKRAGADEKVFLCYKFRSMYEDAEARQAELEAKNEAGHILFKIQNDPRITPIGRHIRRWSMDELPQLINVLKGEMSLVGPRPLPLRDFYRASELHNKRLAIIPGMTGLWQTSGRSNLSFDDMVHLDLHYIDNWSPSLDAKILLKTLNVVLRREGSY